MIVKRTVASLVGQWVSLIFLETMADLVQTQTILNRQMTLDFSPFTQVDLGYGRGTLSFMSK